MMLYPLFKLQPENMRQTFLSTVGIYVRVLTHPNYLKFPVTIDTI